MKSALFLLLAIGPLAAQPADMRLNIVGRGQVTMAIPDFRAAGAAEGLMAAFNQTLWADIDECGLVKLKPKTQYPGNVPQQPSDLTDMRAWSGPPTSADYLAIGYAAIQSDLLVLRGWLLDVRQPTVSAATVLTWPSQTAVSDAGARKLAHEFAAEIIRKLGGKPVYGTRIYFRSDRSGDDQIWVMDADGSNQQPVTSLKSKSRLSAISPALSPDRSMLAFTSYAETFPKIFQFALNESLG
jgi:TolB protein